MTTPFQSKIDKALVDPNLQSALDANAERRRKARLTGYASLPEPIDVMRKRAHEMRAGVIANLDRYEKEFSENAQKNGIIVHHAANSAQAVEIVLEIARKHNARQVAKAKTMVGEEIHINEALEGAGIESIETDLGEYIVQLRGEHPAHIITPAVHLRRQDVSKTFNEKLGLPLTEDVEQMCAAARKELRQVFLNADIGISGVNVGVIENGMLVLVTNEGNGRMVNTVPKVHIALMGTERLVPTLDDLALILYLLPRSASGQKLSVYTSLLHGPRRPEEPDGPEERHLILLDNGRRAIANSALSQSLFCIRCGACLNVCPIFRELGGHAYVSIDGEYSIYPGPIGSVLTSSLFGYEKFGHLVRACSLCGACKDACPVITDFPTMILNLRAGETLKGNVQPNVPGYLKLGLKFFRWIAISPFLFGVAQRAAGVFSRIISPGSSFLRLPAFTGWGLAKDISKPAVRPFRDRFASIKANGTKDKQVVASASPAQPETGAPDQNKPAVSLRELFAEELLKVSANYTFCHSQELAGSIAALLKENGIDTIHSWDQAYLPAGLLDELRHAGIRVVHEADPTIRAGLTGVSGAIAESGTLLIPGGSGKPLKASLLHEFHLAVVKESQIFKALPEALKSPSLYQSSAAVLVTGPSRTADIEMTMSIGMHGPRVLHVFCLPG